jgi:hypothetical protein
MTFEQALAAMRRGEKVRREGWGYIHLQIITNDTIYLFSKDGTVISKGDDIEHADIMATDWQIVPAEVKQPCTKVHEFNGA